MNRGFVYFTVFEKDYQQNDLDKAIDDYNNALELKSSNINMLSTNYYYRCLAYMAKFRGSQSQGLLDKALNDINQAIILHPKKPNYYDSRAKVYLAKNDDANALIDFQKCEELKKRR